MRRYPICYRVMFPRIIDCMKAEAPTSCFYYGRGGGLQDVFEKGSFYKMAEAS